MRAPKPIVIDLYKFKPGSLDISRKSRCTYLWMQRLSRQSSAVPLIVYANSNRGITRPSSLRAQQ
jgi:hypothetical protein